MYLLMYFSQHHGGTIEGQRTSQLYRIEGFKLMYFYLESLFTWWRHHSIKRRCIWSIHCFRSIQHIAHLPHKWDQNWGEIEGGGSRVGWRWVCISLVGKRPLFGLVTSILNKVARCISCVHSWRHFCLVRYFPFSFRYSFRLADVNAQYRSE